MKDQSEIKITQETMIAAAQMYLDSLFAEGKSPVVGAVEIAPKVTERSYGAGPSDFIIKITERKPL